MTAKASAMSRNSTLKGWQVLALLLGFFGVVIGVNVVFVALSLSSFPGEETQHAYAQGLHYNQTLEAKRSQAALGWSATLVRADRVDGAGVIVVRITDRGGDALSSLKVHGALRRPVHAAEDASLNFRALGDGAYEATASGVLPGAWDLRVSAGRGEDTFSFGERVVLR